MDKKIGVACFSWDRAQPHMHITHIHVYYNCVFDVPLGLPGTMF